jgi:hypothetical protein
MEARPCVLAQSGGLSANFAAYGLAGAFVTDQTILLRLHSGMADIEQNGPGIWAMSIHIMICRAR